MFLSMYSYMSVQLLQEAKQTFAFRFFLWAAKFPCHIRWDLLNKLIWYRFHNSILLISISYWKYGIFVAYMKQSKTTSFWHNSYQLYFVYNWEFDMFSSLFFFNMVPRYFHLNKSYMPSNLEALSSVTEWNFSERTVTL